MSTLGVFQVAVVEQESGITGVAREVDDVGAQVVETGDQVICGGCRTVVDRDEVSMQRAANSVLNTADLCIGPQVLLGIGDEVEHAQLLRQSATGALGRLLDQPGQGRDQDGPGTERSLS